MHSEARETSVFAFVLLKPGVTGPNLRPHPADSSCPDPASGTPLTIAGGFPALCGGLFPMAPSVAGRLRFGARNVTISFIANSLSAGSGIGRPMVDQTGLNGTFDFTIEFTSEDRRGAAPDSAPDNGGPTLVEALREQLGIKLESRKSQVDMLVVDHVEHLIEN
jgi:uncharacterized protein (TIGR03435 family)